MTRSFARLSRALAAFVPVTLLAAAAQAGTDPIWSFKGTQSGAGTFRGVLSTDAGALIKIVPFKVPLPDGTTAKTAAEELKKVLDLTVGIREHWNFTVVKDGATYRVTAAPVGGAKVWGKGAPFKNPVGVKDLEIATALDPTIGVARFDIEGSASGIDRGEITIGIAGIRASVLTYDGDGDKTVLRIKQDLVTVLQDAGLSQAFLDSSTGLITVPDVPTGDPFGTGGIDEGAVFLTTDADLGGTAEIALPCPADYTRDGLVDFSDYLVFLNLYDGQDPGADLNLDDLVDFADFLQFLVFLDQGCG